MKKFIKTRLNELLKEMYPLNVPSTLGTKKDIELAKVLQAKPYFDLLVAIRNDWGKDSDVYQALVPFFLTDKFDNNGFIRTLQEYDVYEQYKHLLNLNESK